MAFFVPIMLALPFIAGGTLGGILYADSQSHKRRDLESASHAIVQINAADLRGKDIQELKRLQVDIMTADTPLFSIGDFSVDGNITLHPHNESDKGYTRRALSFRMPGLDIETHGTFILVNETAADNKTRDDFEKVYASLREERAKPMDIKDAFAQLLETL